MSRLIYFYTKETLEKVSFSPELFAKELKKAAKNLLPYEMEHLNNWLTFFTNNKPELKKCISMQAIPTKD
jgi:DNA replication protein DnaD